MERGRFCACLIIKMITGLVLYHGSASAFENIGQIEGAVERLKSGQGETIRLMTVPSMLAYEVLPNTISKVKQVHPKVHIEIDIGGGATQIRALRRGTTHSGPSPHAQDAAVAVRLPAIRSPCKIWI